MNSLSQLFLINKKQLSIGPARIEKTPYVRNNKLTKFNCRMAEGCYKRLATSSIGHICLVVYTLRNEEHGKEKNRIISARKATKKEREVYERQ